MLAELLSKIFVCSCKSNHGMRNLKQLEGNRIVGRCLKCNKRIYGQFLFNELHLKKYDVLYPLNNVSGKVEE